MADRVDLSGADPRAVRFRTLCDHATKHAQAHAWERAGRAYGSAGALALDLDHRGPARRAFEAAGEALRRGDRPSEAADVLRVALSLPGATDDELAASRVRLASVRSELGQGPAALQLCALALDQVDEGPVRALVLDSLVGTLWGYGRKEDARPHIAELRACEGPQGIASSFREGQLHRMDGALDASVAAFQSVIEALAGRAGAEAGVAAAEGEIGEVELLRGSSAPAVEAWTRGLGLHGEAGRQALMYACEAGRARAQVEGGAQPLTGPLDQGIAFARARGMVLLELDLRIARGMALATTDAARAASELDAAVAEAGRIGVRLREGRAALERATRLPLEPVRARELLGLAVAALADHVPLRDRALQALAGVPEAG